MICYVDWTPSCCWRHAIVASPGGHRHTHTASIFVMRRMLYVGGSPKLCYRFVWRMINQSLRLWRVCSYVSSTASHAISAATASCGYHAVYREAPVLGRSRKVECLEHILSWHGPRDTWHCVFFKIFIRDRLHQKISVLIPVLERFCWRGSRFWLLIKSLPMTFCPLRVDVVELNGWTIDACGLEEAGEKVKVRRSRTKFCGVVL